MPLYGGIDLHANKGDENEKFTGVVSPGYGVCVAAERKTGKLDFDVGRPDALETRIRFPVALEKFWAVSQSVCFYATGLSHLSIPLTS